MGIPEWFAYLEDKIFEGLPNNLAKLWPERVLSAIKVGVDVDKIRIPFLIFVLESVLDILENEKFYLQKKAIVDVINYLKAGENNKDELLKLRHAAYAAAYAADAAYAARRKHYIKFSDKLIELLEGLE